MLSSGPPKSSRVGSRNQRSTLPSCVFALVRCLAKVCCGSDCYELLSICRALQGKDAAHIFNALDTAFGGRWSGRALAAPGKLALLQDVADSAGSNRKAQDFEVLQLRDQSGVLYIVIRLARAREKSATATTSALSLLSLSLTHFVEYLFFQTLPCPSEPASLSAGQGEGSTVDFGSGFRHCFSLQVSCLIVRSLIGCRCSMHQLFRVVIGVLERYEVVKRLYCVSNVLSVASRQDALRRSIVRVIRDSLHGGGYLQQPPPSDASPHRKHSRLAVMSLLRRLYLRDEKIFSSAADENVLSKIDAPGEVKPVTNQSIPLVQGHRAPRSVPLCACPARVSFKAVSARAEEMFPERF